MLWHADMLDKLISYFEPNEDVLGLLLFGSYSNPDSHYDYWSDIDVLLVIKNDKLEKFFPTVKWTDAFGKLYTYSPISRSLRITL